MNLLPETEKENLKKGLKLRFVVIALFLLAGAFGIGVLTLLPSYFLALGNLSEIKFTNDALITRDKNAVENILGLPNKINSRLKFFQSNLTSLSALNIFNEIINAVPSGTKLNHLSFYRDKKYKEKRGIQVLISGISQDRESLVLFSFNLKKVKGFLSVDVPVSNLTKEKNLPFSINIFIVE